MRILFVCNQNENRSKTAEDIFKENEHHEVKSAGLFCEEEKKLDRKLVKWADLVIIMEEHQRKEVLRRFPKTQARIISLDIKDTYKYKQPELIQLLKKRTKELGVHLD